MVASLLTYSLARTTNLTRSVHSRIVRTSGPKGKQADRVEPIETGGLHARDSSAMYLMHSSKTLNVVLTVTVYGCLFRKTKATPKQTSTIRPQVTKAPESRHLWFVSWFVPLKAPATAFPFGCSCQIGKGGRHNTA